ncbi:MAG: pyrroline-5-carboxylate reductase [Microbacteriaceae bacterium]|nr:pyrroline-5-carboxylate reductase [Microbacteriaceae bacterium]
MLGTGNMGEAIMTGLLDSEHKIQISVTTRSINSANKIGLVSQNLEGFLQIASLEAHPDANIEAVKDADIVILAVKPIALIALAKEIAPHLKKDALVISVAAGTSTHSLSLALPGMRIIRAMPNTPAKIGKGVTGISAGARATDADIQLAKELFESIGAVAVIDESQLDLLSAVSGSGPAYFYLFVERFTDAAIAAGLEPEAARTLVEETFIGSAALLDHENEAPAELRRAVTSPKGTTEQAIAVFEEADLTTLIRSAMRAAVARAKELNQG